ncbi:PAS domain-containing sensor histidine kinase [Aureimonas frigidaquae]|uniref:PAS domain-containing sensor histidine kinase n=1 Tax=Aureimonas frigidaquae TaxID=424757 RepID=UPI001FCDEFF7|nr:ATP-binding protein [Aureimonas frigidaquae]
MRSTVRSLEGVAHRLTRFLGDPAANLAGWEPLLRKAIPFLTVLFLLVLAFTRFVALMEHRHDVENAAREKLSANATLMRLVDSTLELPAAADRANRLIGQSLPPEFSARGARVLVTDLSGRVVAATSSASDMVGRDATSVLGPAEALLVFGEEAGVMRTEVGGEMSLVAGAVLKAPLGAAILIQPEPLLYADWRRIASISVTLFAMTGVVLLAILLAYFRQSARVAATDAMLAEAHQRVDTALSRGRCGLWDWDLARGRMYWSRSMYEILGMRAQEGVLSFGEVSRLIHPEDGSFFEIARQIASGKLVNMERSFRMRRSDGQYIWLRARAEVVRNTQNDIRLIGVAVDVSENQTLARMTSEANTRLQNAIENVSETFVLWDSQDKLVLCNSKYQEVFGLSDRDIISGTPRETILQRSRKPIAERKLTSPSFVAGERASEALLADGRWLQVSERRMGDGSYVSIGTDITQLKLHQERLSDSERRLMATINDLSAARRDAEAKARALAEMNESYSVEKDRAESANRAKTTFLANMSHELRTPLNAIIGFSEIMRDSAFGPIGNEKYSEYASDIHQSGHYLLKLIDDILDMSKIEAGRMVMAREEIDVGAVAGEALRILDVQARARRLDVRRELSGGMSMQGDRRAVKQVLLNLISNAVKFTPEGGTIRLRTRVAGGSAYISIADTGIGIPPSALNKLGRPFEQVENELTRTNKGTGLGLAIARSLVELQGGSMRISSRVGHGTVVSFRMPLATTPGAAATQS